MKVFIILCFYILIRSFESARILGAFSFTSESHQVVFRSLMKKLASRGHEVVMITPVPSKNKDIPRTLQEVDVSNISFSTWNYYLQFITEEPVSQTEAVNIGVDLINHIAERQIDSAMVQNILNNKTERFDLVFFESCARTILSISIPYEVPVIEVSSLGGYYDTFDLFGAPEHPILNPSFSGKRLYNRSTVETISEVYNYFMSKYLYKQLENKDNHRIKRLFGPRASDVEQLRKKVQLLFLNVHPMWDSNRAVPRNILYFENLPDKPVNTLPENLKLILDSSINGVIYMSFGNNFNTSAFSNNTVTAFIKAFSQLPFDFFIKWNGEDLPGQSDNIKLFKWLPQSDLLRHPKVKVFITQGGLQSTDEAITAGVPLIGIPLLGDQWQNVERYEHYKIGIYLPVKTLSENKLINAIQTITTDNSYRNNVIRLRQLMRDQPHSSLERAVLWTEYLLKNGFSLPLKAPAANMHWMKYYEIELVLYIVAIMFLFIIIIVYSIQVIVSKMLKRNSNLRKHKV